MHITSAGLRIVLLVSFIIQQKLLSYNEKRGLKEHPPPVTARSDQNHLRKMFLL